MYQVKALFLFFFLCCFSTVVAQPFVIDLRGKDLVNHPERLSNQWQMKFGELLSAEEMQAITDKNFQKVPGFWNSDAYDGEKLPGTGYATYYIKVLVDKDGPQLAINPSITSTAYKLFINGIVFGEIGKVGVSKEEAEPNYIKKIYKLPENTEELDIVLHVSNFHYRKGGMGRAPIIGSYEALIDNRSKKIAVLFFLMGSIFFMGLYHVGISLFHRRDKLAIYFSLVCFLTILRSLSVDEYLLIEYLKFPWWLSTKVELVSFFLILGFTIQFIYHMFPSFIPKFFTTLPYYLAVGASIVTAILPMLYSSYLVPVMQITTFLTGVGLLFFIAKESLKGDKEVLIALIGFIFLFGVSAVEIMVHRLQLVGDLVFAFGIFIYLFSHVVIMGLRFNTTFEKNEELGEALQSANKELEAKVLARTKQLDIKNKELIKGNEELKRTNEEKNGLIHIVAHDLKSPLSNNIGLIQLMRMDKDVSAEQLIYLNHLEKSNNQGMSLINDLLVLYNLETQKEINIKPIEVQPYFSEVLKKYTGMASQKQIELREKIDTEEGAFYTDKSLLNRILDNLISNAIKFSHPNTSVTVKASLKNNKLKISVADKGTGILEEEQHKIFKKFQKMSNKPTGNESSSGLGLSIVKELVERLQGEVSFRSYPGKGSTFYVDLPNLKNS
ncbi:ATP-binding protein [Marivirga lumbricoides]|uniref:ATP-binding protein n=1 Tax=Marivirga lumbricoides TaxID=1046115 RepID=UPI001669387C